MRGRYSPENPRLNLPDSSRRGELLQPREFHRVNFWIGITDPKVFETADALFQRIVMATGGSVELDQAEGMNLPVNLGKITERYALDIAKLVEDTLPDFHGREVGRINLECRRKGEAYPTRRALTVPPQLPMELSHLWDHDLLLQYEIRHCSLLPSILGDMRQVLKAKDRPGKVLQDLVEALGGTSTAFKIKDYGDEYVCPFSVRLGYNTAYRGMNGLLKIATAASADLAEIQTSQINFFL